MGKWIAGIILAFVLGAACSYAVFAFVPEITALVAPSRPMSNEPPTRSPANVPDAQTAFTTLAAITSVASHFEQTAMLHNLLRTADRSTVERLLDEATGLRPPSESHAAKRIIYARYAELDPLVAVDRALGEQGAAGQMLLRHVFTAWAKHDFHAALAHTETLPPVQRAAAAASVLQTREDLPVDHLGTLSLEQQLALMESGEPPQGDPARAWQTALAEPAGAGRMMKLRRIAQHWVRIDPRQALAAAAALPSNNDLGPLLIQRWAEFDGESARAWVLNQPESPVRREMLGALAQAITTRDPQSALALAQTLEGAERRQVLEAVLAAWAKTDAPAALAALENLRETRMPQGAQFGIIAGWAQQDPRAAFEWAMAQKTTMENLHLAVIPLQAMAQFNPEEALRLAEQLEGMRGQHAVAAIVSTWAEGDPRAAAAWLESADGDTSSAVAAVAYAYSQTSPAEAFDWFDALPKQKQFFAAHSWASAAAERSPDEASRLISGIRDAEVRAQATQALVMSWAQSEPQDARRWIASGADAEARPTLYRQLFQSWGHFDRDGAVNELRHLGQRDRDRAALGLLEATVFDDADFAAEVYGRIRAAAAKREAAERLYHALMQTDPARAERYRKAAGVGDN